MHTATSDGRLVPSATLGVGDAFGLSALLGGHAGTGGTVSELEATTAVVLLVLEAGSLRGLAATTPSVRATLAGAVRPAHAPSHGHRLTRMTGVFAPPSSDALVAVTPPTSRLLQ